VLARLFRTTGCDTEEVQSVLPLPAIAFTQVGGDRTGCPLNLISQRRTVPANQPLNPRQTRNDLNGAFQRDEFRSSWSIHFGGHAPSGAGGVTTRMHE